MLLQKGGSLEILSSEVESFHNFVYEVLGLLEGASFTRGLHTPFEICSLPPMPSVPLNPHEGFISWMRASDICTCREMNPHTLPLPG